MIHLAAVFDTRNGKVTQASGSTAGLYVLNTGTDGSVASSNTPLKATITRGGQEANGWGRDPVGTMPERSETD